jgi:hypothetical protein
MLVLAAEAGGRESGVQYPQAHRRAGVSCQYSISHELRGGAGHARAYDVMRPILTRGLTVWCAAGQEIALGDERGSGAADGGWGGGGGQGRGGRPPHAPGVRRQYLEVRGQRRGDGLILVFS